MNTGTINGQSARVEYGYYDAATLGPWSIVLEGSGGALTATVERADTYRVSQRPVTFVVDRPGTAWRWPIESLQVADGTLTARLGPQE